MGTVILWIFFSELPLTLANTLSRLCLDFLKALSLHRIFTFLAKPLHFCERLYARLLVRLNKLKSEMRVAATAIRSDVPFIVKMVFLTLLFYILSWLNVYSAFKAFDVEVSLLAICALVPAVMIVAQIPVTLLGNLGYFESVFVFYFLLVGVGGAETLAMGLLLRIKLLCVGAVGFLVYMLYKRKYQLNPERIENVV
jgi:uncharacterized protein (TIRG00374 family)